MKVLVSGASGFLGREVVNCLVKGGHHVRAIVRPASKVPQWDNQVEIFRADLRAEQNLKPAFSDMDAVVHLAAATSGNEDVQFTSTVVGTERFLEAMESCAVKRLIHLSSLVVYDWARARRVMDENTPLVSDPYSMGGYTVAKVWQERVVAKFAKSNSWALTVMRPGFIWGKEHEAIAGMGRHFGRIYLMFGPFTRLPLCHVANCADCVAATLERPAAIGQTFNVIDSDDIRVWRYVVEYARRTGKRGLMLPVPYVVGYGAAWLALLTSRWLFGDKGKLPSLLIPRRFESQFKPIRFSNRKLKEILGWQPPMNFNQCVSLTYGTTTKPTVAS
jgi:UDP-glucose 4-epimerase